MASNQRETSFGLSVKLFVPNENLAPMDFARRKKDSLGNVDSAWISRATPFATARAITCRMRSWYALAGVLATRINAHDTCRTPIPLALAQVGAACPSPASKSPSPHHAGTSACPPIDWKPAVLRPSAIPKIHPRRPPVRQSTPLRNLLLIKHLHRV